MNESRTNESYLRILYVCPILGIAQEVKLELQEGAKSYHAGAYNTPRCHIQTLKADVERLVKIGVLKKVNLSEWAAPTFIIPKKDGSVRLISDF